MSNEQTTTVKGGIGFSGLLTIAFIILKLCGVIDWSWLWVLSPLWIGAAAIIGLIVVIWFIALIINLFMMR